MYANYSPGEEVKCRMMARMMNSNDSGLERGYGNDYQITKRTYFQQPDSYTHSVSTERTPHVRNRKWNGGSKTFQKRPYSRRNGSRSASLEDTIQRGKERNASALHDTSCRTTQGDTSTAHKIPSCLLKMIVIDLQPLSIVEDKGICAVMRAIEPTQDISRVTSKDLRLQLLQMYKETKEMVKKELASSDDISLTSELWVSRAEVSFVTVTCHYLGKDWHLKSHVLETANLPDEHTPKNIVDQMLKTAKAWGIKDKIHTVVMEGGTTMKDEVSKAGWTHISCLAYTLDLVFKDVLEKYSGLKTLLKKSQNVVRFFHCDIKAEQKLKEYQLKLKLPESVLIQSVGNGWLSSLSMLERFVEQHQAITAVLLQRLEYNLWLADEDIKTINDVIAALQPFKKATKEMPRAGYESISFIIPLMNRCQRDIEKLAQNGNEVAFGLAKMCEWHFCNVKLNRWLTVSTVLDPRFKKLLLSDDNKVQLSRRQILKAMDDISTSAVSAPVGSGKPSHFDCDFMRYVKERPITMFQSPLKWWRVNKDLVDLKRIAHKYLGVVCTAIPLERVFAKEESHVFCNRRSCLETENVNMVLFLNSNCSTTM